MDKAQQIAVGQQLFEHIAHHSTATAEDLYWQPTSEYICPDIAAREARLFFREQPLCLGLSGILPKPGTFYTHDLSGVPIILSRDEHGKVAAMLNVCRHRGARVAEGCGSARSFSCPYHAWTYASDGHLVARPEEAAFAQSPRALHGLTQLPVLEQDGLIWVIPQPGRELRLVPEFDRLRDALAGFNLANQHHYESRVITRKVNWKLLLDTFLESYHFCVLHKDSICSIFYDNLTTFDSYGPHFRLVSARRTIETMRDQPSHEWNLLPHIVAIYILFPNTVLVWQLDHIELWQIFPTSGAPDESTVLLSLYTPEPAITDSARRHWTKNLDLVVHVVENEDFPVGEGVQRGFHAGAQDHVVFGRNEPGLMHFHRHVTAALAS
jgi:phenylpropionate dioxygenase-like ring-hydroxylating dioxygenase large terminal subunit